MKRVFSITVNSFTIAILLVCGISVVLNEPLPFFIPSFPLKLALMCLLIALLMKGYEELFSLMKLPFYMAADIGIRAIIVFGMTFWFGPFIGAYEIRNPIVLGIVIGIVIVTLVATYIVSYRAFKDEVGTINQVIKMKKGLDN